MDRQYRSPAQGCSLKSVVVVAMLGLHLVSGVSRAGADELVYQPVNPAFGGNPLNSSFLLSTAEAHRPSKPQKKQSPTDRFADTIQSALLSRISQKIADAILGESAQDRGTFTVGATQIDFQRDGGQVKINVKDPNGSVTLEVPVADLLSGRS